MPIYEFVCHNCGFEFERIQSFSDETVPGCTNCQSQDVMRRVGRPAIHFKGGGWYITDSKAKSKESAVGSGNGDKSDSGAEKAPTKEPATKESAVKEPTTKESATKESAAEKTEKSKAPD